LTETSFFDMFLRSTEVAPWWRCTVSGSKFGDIYELEVQKDGVEACQGCSRGKNDPAMHSKPGDSRGWQKGALASFDHRWWNGACSHSA